ncbi:TGACG-sequence-specific DNA-binding protein TGA-2.1 [Platanthera guangdongensis]|uniref:TGACG-sequence-specific DNA-binding protein TGA-2.1 n=1 Tax=Platanthera guangdongensis TaxID=2320717 RepID=A0ABR2M7U4_9ASPA
MLSTDSYHSSGVLAFDLEYARWLEEQNRLVNELRSAVNAHASDNELRAIVDGIMAHYDEIFKLKVNAAKADVFHMLSGMWKTPAERCFLWLGGFRSSEILKSRREGWRRPRFGRAADGWAQPATSSAQTRSARDRPRAELGFVGRSPWRLGGEELGGVGRPLGQSGFPPAGTRGLLPHPRGFGPQGGFRADLLVNQLEPLTEQQLVGMCNLQQSSLQAEDALSQGMEALQQSLSETLAGSLGPSGSSDNVANYMGQMAMAMGKLGTLESFLRQASLQLSLELSSELNLVDDCSQADNLRHQTLQQMHRILTTRQSARALLAISDYFSRLRALSSLWLARPRILVLCSHKGESCAKLRKLWNGVSWNLIPDLVDRAFLIMHHACFSSRASPILMRCCISSLLGSSPSQEFLLIP